MNKMLDFIKQFQSHGYNAQQIYMLVYIISCRANMFSNVDISCLFNANIKQQVMNSLFQSLQYGIGIDKIYKFIELQLNYNYIDRFNSHYYSHTHTSNAIYPHGSLQPHSSNIKLISDQQFDILISACQYISQDQLTNYISFCTIESDVQVLKSKLALRRLES